MAYDIGGPAVGTVGVGSVFTVIPDAPLTGTITPAVAGATVAPASLTWSGTQEPKTFTVTAPGHGDYLVGATNDAGLPDPSWRTWTAFPAPPAPETVERDELIARDIRARLAATGLFDPVRAGTPEESPIAATEGEYLAAWVFVDEETEAMADLDGENSLADHVARFGVGLEVWHADPEVRESRLARGRGAARNALVRVSLAGFTRRGQTRFTTGFATPDVPIRLPAIRTAAVLEAVYSVKDRGGRDAVDAEPT